MVGLAAGAGSWTPWTSAGELLQPAPLGPPNLLAEETENPKRLGTSWAHLPKLLTPPPQAGAPAPGVSSQIRTRLLKSLSFCHGKRMLAAPSGMLGGSRAGWESTLRGVSGITALTCARPGLVGWREHCPPLGCFCVGLAPCSPRPPLPSWECPPPPRHWDDAMGPRGKLGSCRGKPEV